MKVTHIQAEFGFGTIDDAIDQARVISGKNNNAVVSFVFNTVEMNVKATEVTSYYRDEYIKGFDALAARETSRNIA